MTHPKMVIQCVHIMYCVVLKGAHKKSDNELYYKHYSLTEMGPRKRPFLRPNGPRPVVRMSTGCFKSWAKKGVYSKIRSFEFFSSSS